MLNSEYKVLKYIKNHGPVTKKKIRDRFPKYDIDEKILPNLHPYISIDNF